MLAKLASYTLVGIDATPVEVEVELLVVVPAVDPLLAPVEGAPVLEPSLVCVFDEPPPSDAADDPEVDDAEHRDFGIEHTREQLSNLELVQGRMRHRAHRSHHQRAPG